MNPSTTPVLPTRRAAVLLAALAIGACAASGARAQPAVPPAPATPAATTVAGAGALTWRQTSVLTDQQAFVQIRRGVALFGDGEPATVSIRLQPTKAPVDGRVTMVQDTRFRFEDGSTFALRATTVLELRPDGSVIGDRSEWNGEFSGGTGRYAGIAGTIRLTGRTGLDTKADGILGDNFAMATARYTLPR